jgi:Protein of unknown function (DUF550)
MDLKQHLVRQMAWSKATFGPGARTAGVLDHMTKEMVEVRDSNGSSDEWVDLVILALDGLTRQLWSASEYRKPADEIAETAVRCIACKQSRNELRDWPDWRTADPNKAIEHVRRKSVLGQCLQCGHSHPPDGICI